MIKDIPKKDHEDDHEDDTGSEGSTEDEEDVEAMEIENPKPCR